MDPIGTTLSVSSVRVPVTALAAAGTDALDSRRRVGAALLLVRPVRLFRLGYGSLLYRRRSAIRETKHAGELVWP